MSDSMRAFATRLPNGYRTVPYMQNREHPTRCSLQRYDSAADAWIGVSGGIFDNTDSARAFVERFAPNTRLPSSQEDKKSPAREDILTILGRDHQHAKAHRLHQCAASDAAKYNLASKDAHAAIKELVRCSTVARDLIKRLGMRTGEIDAALELFRRE